MNDKLTLYLQNVEKIKRYFGVDADKFVYNLALRYTGKHALFHYADYESIAQEIKKHTKWYHFVSANFHVTTSYAAHFGKNYEKVSTALHYHRLLINFFTRGDHSYIAAMFGETLEDAQRVKALSDALTAKSSSQFFTLPLPSRALLATRLEEVDVLATTVQHYYDVLIKHGFARHSLTYECAFLLTLHSGSVDATLITQLQNVLTILNKAETSLKKRHYPVVTLLAIAGCSAEDFIALYALHDELCTKAKLNPKLHPTLLIATQLYITNYIPIDLPTSPFTLSEVMHTFDGGSNIVGGTDNSSSGDGGGE